MFLTTLFLANLYQESFFFQFTASNCFDLVAKIYYTNQYSLFRTFSMFYENFSECQNEIIDSLILTLICSGLGLLLLCMS